MKEVKTNRQTALAALASELRMLQAECADQSDALRIQSLDEQVGQALETVLPQDRAAFLEDLRSYFPTWHATGESHAASAPTPAAPPPPPAPLDAVAYAEGLAKLASTLSDDKKQQIARHLAKFGYIPPALAASASSGTTLPAGASATVKEILGITSNDPLDVPKALEAMAVLAQFSSDLDQVAWDTWKAIQPNSSIRRQVDLRSAVAGFVVGDPKAPKPRVAGGVESLRLLVAALTASIPLAGKTASSEFRKISASKVEELVTAEGGRGWKFEQRCWAKYKDLSEAALPALERNILKEIAQVVEDWMRKAR